MTVLETGPPATAVDGAVEGPRMSKLRKATDQAIAAVRRGAS